jgi:UDP-apiose/xylose synthase
LPQALLRREPLKLVDGGESQRTFVYIKDAIEAVLLMIVRAKLYPLFFPFFIYILMLKEYLTVLYFI